MLDRRKRKAEAPRPWGRAPPRHRFGRRLLVLSLVGLAIAAGITALDMPWPRSPAGGAYMAGYILIGTVLLAYLAARRESLSALARHFGAWLGLALLLVLGYGYRYEISEAGDRLLAILVPSRGYRLDPETVSFPAASDGHFWIDARANGVRTPFSRRHWRKLDRFEQGRCESPRFRSGGASL